MHHHNISIKKEILVKNAKMSDKQIAQLVSFGFLLPHSTQLDLYWFSVRKQGTFMSNLSGGRIELLRIIKKRNTRDIMEKVHICNRFLKVIKFSKWVCFIITVIETEKTA